MDPDFLITIAFVSLVILVALVAGFFARSEWRRNRDADSSTGEIEAIPEGVPTSIEQTLNTITLKQREE